MLMFILLLPPPPVLSAELPHSGQRHAPRDPGQAARVLGRRSTLIPQPRLAGGRGRFFTGDPDKQASWDHRTILSSLTWYQTESKQKLLVGEAMPVSPVKTHRPT